MAISAFTGIQHGCTYQPGKSDQIISDGQVENRFVTPGESFISSITDPRIQQFCKTDAAPSADWHVHELGGFDSASQSLYKEDGRVILRSNGADHLRHLIQAPFDPATGAVNLDASTEGFDTAPQENDQKTVTFDIPVGGNIEFGGVFNLDDANTLGNLLK